MNYGGKNGPELTSDILSDARGKMTVKGNYYFCVALNKSLGYGSKIWIHADACEIVNGDIRFLMGDKICFSFSKGSWIFYYMASVIDGGSIFVEHWEDEEKSPKAESDLENHTDALNNVAEQLNELGTEICKYRLGQL